MTPAVFLDRDGVLIEDAGLLVEASRIRVLPGVAEALLGLRQAGFKLLVVTNQPVVARGLLTQQGVCELQGQVEQALAMQGAPPLDGFYFCPHHPKADLPEWRVACECRKPAPGMLLRAAREHAVDLARSFMVGDRITDIIAGARSGCRTILVRTGKHLEQPIETAEPLDTSIHPDHACAGLREAAVWILKVQ